MQISSVSRLMFSLALSLAWGLAWAVETASPMTTLDGLQLIDDTELALVYAAPGVDLGRYNRVYLQDAYIAFKKNWQRDQNRNSPYKIKTSDMERIKAELAVMFREVFSETLEEGGYQLVNERAEDVLLIKPAIINLDIYAPEPRDASQHTHSFAESAGEMTLYLELYDSVSDDIIAKALDRKKDRQTGYFQWYNRVTNRAAANRILKVWANVLKEGLDEAREITSG